MPATKKPAPKPAAAPTIPELTFVTDLPAVARQNPVADALAAQVVARADTEPLSYAQVPDGMSADTLAAAVKRAGLNPWVRSRRIGDKRVWYVAASTKEQPKTTRNRTTKG